MEQKNDANNELDTLEDQDTKVTATPEKGEDTNKDDKKSNKNHKFSIGRLLTKLNSRLNVYSFGFYFVGCYQFDHYIHCY